MEGGSEESSELAQPLQLGLDGDGGEVEDCFGPATEDSALISGAVEAPLHPVHAAQFTTASDMWSAEERKDERRLTQLEASKRALEGINEPGGICKHCDGRVSVISGLEQAVQQLKDRLHTFEVKHDNVSQMGKQVQEMEETSDALARACREEQRQRQMCKALESEVCDLRALLRAVEQTSAEAELRHLNTVSALIKEKEGLHEEVENFQHKCNVLDASFGKVQEELLDVSTRLEESRAKLGEAVCKNNDSQAEAASYRVERDELQRKLDSARGDMAELAKFRELDHVNTVEQVKRSCESSWRTQENSSQQRISSLRRKIHQLQAKVKQAHKQMARLTFDRNELLIQQQEYEAQLSALRQHSSRIRAPGFHLSSPKSKLISAEISQVAARQARYFADTAL
ncbi:hypothetical protein SELMODRAFT_409633 [Selaginella moellendorffii]|uniref:Uncharacterized protein n=1 Tax=Selaginella moellendorffii TaxID=88036 RepID=D8RDI6_SELML|nr:hypothetical protein SELMODRAFT_409633 [Selaginella moellendorffii]